MTKEELQKIRRSIRDLTISIESKRRQREELYYRVTGSAIPIKTTWVQESAQGDKMAAVMAEVADLGESIDKDIGELLSLRWKAETELSTLSKPELVSIMTDYYIHGYTWERTAEVNNYSVQMVYILHREALKELN